VKNHPHITAKTPVIRYTALSRPQTPSAKDVPIETINVTYVVERGNLSDVAIAIKILATVRLIEARSKSNDPASFLYHTAL